MVFEVFLKIYGEVHGVGFRYEAWQLANKLNLTGWAHNAPDGTVEICAQGKQEDLKKLITWVRHSSPGTVGKIETEWREPSGSKNDFRIL